MTYHQAKENILYFNGVPCVLVRSKEMNVHFTLMNENCEPADFTIACLHLRAVTLQFWTIKNPIHSFNEYIGRACIKFYLN